MTAWFGAIRSTPARLAEQPKTPASTSETAHVSAHGAYIPYRGTNARAIGGFRRGMIRQGPRASRPWYRTVPWLKAGRGISERRLNSDHRVVGGAGLTVSTLPQTVGGTHDVPRNCT
jgi:hypothetical protein